MKPLTYQARSDPGWPTHVRNQRTFQPFQKLKLVLKFTGYSFVASLSARRPNHKTNEPQGRFKYSKWSPGCSKLKWDLILRSVKDRNGKHLVEFYGLGSLTSRKGTQFFWAVERPSSTKTGWRDQSRWKVGRLNLSSLPTAHTKLAGRSVGTTWSSESAVGKKCYVNDEFY